MKLFACKLGVSIYIATNAPDNIRSQIENVGTKKISEAFPGKTLFQ